MGANASKVEGEAGGQGVWEIVGSVQPTASKPEYISDRVLAFAYEDVRLGVPSLERVLASSANVQSASDGYIDCLVSAAAFLQEHHSGSYMIVNLGGLLLEPKLYSMFGNSCVEFVVPWNAPIGCGVCPLDILFATCSSIHNWLSMDDDHIAVLHTRTAPGGHADQFLRFVAACYLTYSLEFDHVSEALDVVMPDKAKGSAQQPRRRGSMGSLIRSPLSVTMNSPLKKKWLKGKPDSQDQRPSSRERASPSQRRYGQYFMNVLHSPVLPQWQRTPVLLRRIVLSFEPLGGTCGNQHFSVGTSATSGAGGEPVLVVHRRGQEIWAGVADTGDIQSRRDLVGFEPELLVVGDVVLSLWAGDRQRQHEMPIFSIPLNTAFVDRSVMRLTSRQVEQSANFPLPDDFFIDITFDDLDQRALDRHSSLPQDALMSLDEARHGWKSVLAATSGMSVTDFYAYEDVVHEIQARHATLSRGSSEGVERAQSDLREALKDIRAAQVDQEDGEGEGEGALDPEPTINASPAPPPPPPQAKQQPRPVAHKAAASLAALAVSPPPPPPPPPPSGGVPPPPPPPPRPGVPGAPPPPPPPGGALRGARKPYTGPKLRSWYWQAVNNVQGTVWSEIAAAPFVTGSRAESVRCRLVDLFPARAAGKQVKASGSASKAASLVKYIPLARANNISIMLTQFRGGGHEGLREAILGGRDFTLEQLGVLLQLIPTEEETRIMANVDPKDAPGLSEPEKFLLALSKIPRLRNKIQCRVFMSQFDTWAAEFREGLAANLEACRAARSSPLLRSVLGTSLAVGNLLHIGTSRHGAHGIRLESLLKMRDLRVTRGVKDSTGRGARNLLDVVASEVAEGSGRRESLREELRAVHRATAYPQSDLLALMNQLEAGLAMVRAELEAGGGDPAWLADFEAKARRAKAECEEEAEGTLREAAEVVTFFGEGRNASSEEVFATLWSLAGQYDEALDRVPKNSK